VITNAKQPDDEPDGALSRNGVWVRLSAERWQHIATEHPELAALRTAVLQAIADADHVLEGHAGELLAVLSAGAYCMSMASNYNTRGRPAEVLVDGSQVHLIREREDARDQMRSERLV
jgi:hypothetical protein